ncbi:MAG: hypothetical protein RhofKO_09530 [Rhodothermales bacterium]
MSDPKSRFSDEYRHTRAAFEDLKIEEKAIFVVESVLTTFAQTIESIFRTVAQEIDRAVDKMDCHDEDDDMPGVEEILEDEADVEETPPPPAPKKATKTSRVRKKAKDASDDDNTPTDDA